MSSDKILFDNIVEVVRLRNSGARMTEEQEILDLQLEGIATSTLESRLSHLRKVVDAGFEITPRGVMKFMNQSRRAQIFPGGTLDGIAQSARYFVMLRGRKLEPDSHGTWEQLNHFVRGYKRRHPVKIVEKGAINHAQYSQLLSHMVQVDPNVAKDQIRCVEFQYGFAFRPGHVCMVTRNEFYLDEQDGLWKYYGKNFKMKPNDPEMVQHECMPWLQDNVSKFLEEAPPGDQPLFPDYNITWVGRMIKACARAHGWPPGVKWNGAHCLRHGSIADAYAAGGLGAGRRRGGHFSDAMVMRYGRPTEERLNSTPRRVYKFRAVAGQLARRQHAARTSTTRSATTRPATADSTEQTQTTREKTKIAATRIRKRKAQRAKTRAVSTKRKANSK